jgi:hypothetical protein
MSSSSSHAANKRKPDSEDGVVAVNSEKRTKTESSVQLTTYTARLVGECHPHFNPVGAYVQLAVIGWSCNSAQVFGIEPLFRLMLDYLGSYSAWVLWYFYHEDDDCKGADSGGALVSVHYTEAEALSAALAAWCGANMDELEERGAPLSAEPDPNWSAIMSFASRIQSSPQYTHWGDREVLQLIISDSGGIDAMRDVWDECESWQEDREGEYTVKASGRYFELKEMPFGIADAPPAASSPIAVPSARRTVLLVRPDLPVTATSVDSAMTESEKK